MVQFVSVENMVAFVHDRGLENILMGIAGEIESDFKRWEEFEKQPRIPSHSEKGVIELTLEHVTRGVITLGDADRVVMTAEDARDLIETLQEAVEDAEAYQDDLVIKDLTEAS